LARDKIKREKQHILVLPSEVDEIDDGKTDA
jgi:hypothetical protein